MTEREFQGPDARVWRFRARPAARRDDGDMQLTLELESLGERRVVICLRGEWERDDPDFLDLLARSLPGGGSRGLGAGPPAPPEEKSEPPADPGLMW